MTPASDLSLISYPIVFAIGGKRDFRVEVEPRKVDGRNGMAGRVFATYSPSESVQAALLALAEGRDPVGSTFEASEETLGEPLPPQRILPQSLEDFFRMVSLETSDIGHRTGRVIRWRTGKRGDHNPFVGGGLSWSEDTVTWHPVPARLKISVSQSGSCSLRGSVVEDITSAVARGLDEPLARRVFREAAEQRSENPRSALLLGYVAAETGLKSFLSATGGPELRWLLLSLPSPSIERMLKELLPIATGLTLPEDMHTTFKKAQSKRNDVVHKPGESPSPELIESFIDCVDQLLWTFDVLSGNAWARLELGEELRGRVDAALAARTAP